MLDPTVWTVACGLGCAATWGAGDFSGGMATKKGDVFVITLISQTIGLAALFLTALVLDEPLPVPGQLAYGAVAGIAGMFGILCLYTGLAQGRMGIVAPVSAVVTAILPVIAALVTEGWPGPSKMAGFAVALLAVWWLSREDGPVSSRPREWRRALSAGAGFGLFFILIARASIESVLWPLVAARIASIAFMAVAVHRRKRARATAHLPLFPIAMAGLLDAAGNIFFALAAQIGRLDIAAVVGSLYPATTVLLARTVLKEQLHVRQYIGLAAALSAVVAITM